MDTQMRDLIDALSDHSVKMLNLERQFANLLRGADKVTLSEVCYYMADALCMHRELPDDVSTSLDKCEQYIQHKLRVTNWKFDYDELMHEFDLLMATSDDCALLDDLDDDEEASV